MADDLVGDGLHHIGAGHVHIARVLHHEDEVGDGRRIDVAPRARPHDHADLGNDAAGQGVLQEDVGVAARLSTPSWIRAPPASNRPMIGAPVVRAIFCSLTILAAWAPDRLPPNTVKSLEKT